MNVHNFNHSACSGQVDTMAELASFSDPTAQQGLKKCMA